ncbi:hypothetical protein BTA35_0216975, partial [Oceanospirillum linum]
LYDLVFWLLTESLHVHRGAQAVLPLLSATAGVKRHAVLRPIKVRRVDLDIWLADVVRRRQIDRPDLVEANDLRRTEPSGLDQ